MKQTNTTNRQHACKEELIKEVRLTVKQLLEQNWRASDVSHALTYVATEMGLVVSKYPADVLYVALQSINEAIIETKPHRKTKQKKVTEDLMMSHGLNIIH